MEYRTISEAVEAAGYTHAAIAREFTRILQEQDPEARAIQEPTIDHKMRRTLPFKEWEIHALMVLLRRRFEAGGIAVEYDEVKALCNQSREAYLKARRKR